MFSLQVKPSESALNGITLYEQIDLNELNTLKSSDFVKYQYKESWGLNDYGNEKLHLSKYADNYKKRSELVAVTYTRGKRKLGRVYPFKSLGMTCIRRVTRNTLMRKKYYDIDIDNAHPRILRDIIRNTLPAGKSIELEYPHLDDYCDDRERLISEIMSSYRCDRARAKNAFIALMYGGTVSSWKHGKDGEMSITGTDPEVESFLDKFYSEIQTITTLFIDNNKELYEKECDTYRKKPENKGQKNERGSFFSAVMQDYEIKIIEYLMTHIIDLGVFTKVEAGHIITYSYDGFMLLKDRVDANGGIRVLLEDLTQLVYDTFGLELDFSMKDMNKDYHTEFVYEPDIIIREDNSALEVREKKDKKESKRNNEEKSLLDFKGEFEKMQVEFEKENFKVIQNSCFVQETFDEENNRKLIQRNTSELTVAFSHLNLKYKAWEDDKQVEKCVPFIPVWIKCETIRRYDRMDCFPDISKCPANCFNIWTPFEMERYNDTPLHTTPDVWLGVMFLRNHLSIMCDHQTDTLEEFEKWIAQMIQFPDTKTHMPIFQSAEGSGKGSFVQLMRKLLGVSKVSLTANPEEYVWGRFNNMMETTFLVFFDEISKQMTGSGIDKIKNLITEPTIQIQHKGKGAYEMKSFHRFAGLTNAWDGGMTINKGSRRFLMCKMSDEMKGNMEYWSRFYSLLENLDVLRGFYNYYKTMEVTKILPPPKMTEFALELQKLSVDVPTLWVKDLIADAKRNKPTYLINNKKEYKIVNDEFVIELSGKMACSMLMEWCKDNGYSRYETTPIKLGVFLKTKKWEGLIKGRETNMGDTRYYRVDTLLKELAD